MSTAHNAKELTEEQKEEQKQKERFIDPIEQETESTFSQLFTFAAAIGWGKIKGDRDRFELFQAISNSRLSETLLDLSSPQNINNAKALFKTVKEDFDRENFDAKTKTYKKTTATRGSLWGRAPISVDTLTKAEQQIIVGKHFHSLVNSHEANIRIDQAVSIYGIDKKEFTNNLSKWMKENPGSDFDTALHTVARNQFTFEKTGTEDGSLTKEQDVAIKLSQEKVSQKELKDEAHQKALEYGESIKSEAEGVMTKINSLEKGLDAGQFQTELNAIGQSVQGPVPEPTTSSVASTSPPLGPLSSPSGSTTGMASIEPVPAQAQVYVATEPTIGGLQQSSSMSTAASAPIGNSSPVPIQTKGLRGLKGLLGKAAGLFSKLKSLASVLSNATLAIPGVGEIVKGIQIAKRVLDRIPIIGQAVNNAINSAFSSLLKFFGLSLLAIFLFLLIFITSLSDPSTLFSPTPNLSASTGSNLSWSAFEKDYLQIAQKKEEKDVSWNEFQKQFLSSSKIYLSETSSH